MAESLHLYNGPPFSPQNCPFACGNVDRWADRTTLFVMVGASVYKILQCSLWLLWITTVIRLHCGAILQYKLYCKVSL